MLRRRQTQLTFALFFGTKCSCELSKLHVSHIYSIMVPLLVLKPETAAEIPCHQPLSTCRYENPDAYIDGQTEPLVSLTMFISSYRFYTCL